MSKWRVSNSLTAEDVSAIADAIQVIRSRLPFLLAASPRDRREMLKLGPRSIEFVKKIKQVLVEHPDLVPPALDVPEFMKDVDLVDAMGEFEPELTQLAEVVSDTRMIAGSEAMGSALLLYGVLKPVSRSVPGLDTVLGEMGARLKHRKRSRSEATAEGEVDAA